MYVVYASYSQTGVAYRYGRELELEDRPDHWPGGDFVEAPHRVVIFQSNFGKKLNWVLLFKNILKIGHYSGSNARPNMGL